MANFCFFFFFAFRYLLMALTQQSMAMHICIDKISASNYILVEACCELNQWLSSYNAKQFYEHNTFITIEKC